MSRYSRHRIYNLSRPEKSVALSVALAKAAGGSATEAFGQSTTIAEDFSIPPLAVKHPIVFTHTDDPDYQAILVHIQAAGKRLRQIKRFDMPDFRPAPEYLREMRRYGLLPPSSIDDRAPIDSYEADRRYWAMIYAEGLAKDLPKP